jgi:lysophospholipase L1-like esterase
MDAILIALWIVLAASLAPVAANRHCRNVYRQTLAHWLSKVVPPPSVFIGDSLVTGGMWFDDIRNINLASNGLITDQIAGNLKLAQAYRPKRIVIMAGMNDAIRGFDPVKIRALWVTICEEPSIVVTLVPPTKHDHINCEIQRINRIILECCQGRPVVALDLADESGRIRPEYASDGVHFGPKGYEQWVAQLKAL